MQKTLWVKLGLLIVTVGFLFVVSCAPKPVDSTPPDAQTGTTGEEETGKATAEELAQQQADQQALDEETLKREKATAREMFVSEDIHFDYNDSALRTDAQNTLQRKAQWLQENQDVAVVVEGHCDERGSTEYNLALGDRRAESVKRYLVDLGVTAARVTTISYGEEMPVDRAGNEAAWAKNRRAHFTVD